MKISVTDTPLQFTPLPLHFPGSPYSPHLQEGQLLEGELCLVVVDSDVFVWGLVPESTGTCEMCPACRLGVAKIASFICM